MKFFRACFFMIIRPFAVWSDRNGFRYSDRPADSWICNQYSSFFDLFGSPMCFSAQKNVSSQRRNLWFGPDAGENSIGIDSVALRPGGESEGYVVPQRCGERAPCPDTILGRRIARRGMQLSLRGDLSLRRLDRGSRSPFGPCLLYTSPSPRDCS